MKTLLEKGYEPNDGENGGCSMIPVLLNDMTWRSRFDYNLSWSFRDDDKCLLDKDFRHRENRERFAVNDWMSSWIPAECR